MALARRIAPLLALLLLALTPAASSATCTATLLPGGGTTKSTSTSGATLASGCASTVLSVTPNPLDAGATATFDGSGSYGNTGTSSDIARYDWDYGDGATASTLSTATNPSITTHAYAARGHYVASLTTYDSSNAALATSAPVSVYVGSVPVAALAPPPSDPLRPGVAYTFDASGSYAPDSAGGGSIVQYQWDWGDGSAVETTTTATASHAFAEYASTSVSVTVVNDIGLVSAPASQAITVEDKLPVVTLTASPSTVDVGQQLTLDATGSYDPDGSIAKYCWDLDATGSYKTCTGLVSHVTAGGYPNPGIVVLGVKVFDDNGRWSKKSVAITVQSPPTTSGGSTGGGTTTSGDTSGSTSGSGSTSTSGSGSGGTGGTSGGTTGGSGGSGGSSSGGSSGIAIGTFPAGEAFTVALDGAAVQRLKGVLRRGIGLRAAANRDAKGRLTVTVSTRDAMRLHLVRRSHRAKRSKRGHKTVAIGRARLSLTPGRTATLKIKLTRKAARALRHTRLRTIRATVRGKLSTGSDTAAVVRVVVLRR